MKLTDLKQFILENSHSHLQICMDEDDYDIRIIDKLFKDGWDYFLLTDEEGVTFFPKIIIESVSNTYMTSPVSSKEDCCMSLYKWVDYESINISKEKVLKYIKMFEMELKKTKEKVILNEAQKDFE